MSRVIPCSRRTRPMHLTPEREIYRRREWVALGGPFRARRMSTNIPTNERLTHVHHHSSLRCTQA